MQIISLSFLNGERTNQWKCFGVFLTISVPLIIATATLPALNPLFFILNLLIGVLGWTYLEYHLHRFWTHKKNGATKEGSLGRHIHHHTHPAEIKVTALQRGVLIIITILFLVASVTWNNYFTVMAGFTGGFSYSFFSHWLLHQKWSAKICPNLHRFHIWHHCKQPDKCFGFSTILWDLVFGTHAPKDAVISKKVMQFYYGEHSHE